LRRLLEKMLLGGAKIYSDFPVKRKVTIISLAYAGIFMQKIIANTPFFRERCAKEPTFLIRKVGKRISHRTHHFVLTKLLKFQETFLEKFLVSGFGAEAPTDNARKKARRCRAFLYCRKKLELRSKLCFKRLFEKAP